MASEKIYQMVTERVVKAIQDAIKAIQNGEKGESTIAPWNRPWIDYGSPINMVSKKHYRGINVWLLTALGYSSPFFVSYKQASQLGGKVKKGEKGCPVIFWKPIKFDKDKAGNPITDADGNPTTKTVWLLRYYTVFNVEQCEGFEDKIPELKKREFHPVEDAEAIIANMPNRPAINYGGNKAAYSPSLDSVMMPKKEQFKSDNEYYSTIFHELVHSTGHSSRLNRNEVMDLNFFGSHEYSKEELTAEMGAVFLCNEVGIESTLDNSLSYLKSWLEKLQDDTKLLIVASGKAQKASDYILDRKPDYKSNEDDEEKEDSKE